MGWFTKRDKRFLRNANVKSRSDESTITTKGNHLTLAQKNIEQEGEYTDPDLLQNIPEDVTVELNSVCTDEEIAYRPEEQSTIEVILDERQYKKRSMFALGRREEEEADKKMPKMKMYSQKSGSIAPSPPLPKRSGPPLDLGGKPRVGSIAVVQNGEEIEAHDFDQAFSIAGYAGHRTRFSIIPRDSARYSKNGSNRKRLGLLCCFCCLFVLLAIGAVLLWLWPGFLVKSDDSMLLEVPPENTPDGNGDVDGQVADASGEMSDVILFQDDKGNDWLQGCFDYSSGPQVCLEKYDETTSDVDELCVVMVDGNKCDSCTVCSPPGADDKQGGSSIKVDCTNLDEYGEYVNQNCAAVSDEPFEDSLLAAFVPGTETHGLGSWISKQDDANDVEEPDASTDGIIAIEDNINGQQDTQDDTDNTDAQDNADTYDNVDTQDNTDAQDNADNIQDVTDATDVADSDGNGDGSDTDQGDEVPIGVEDNQDLDTSNDADDTDNDGAGSQCQSKVETDFHCYRMGVDIIVSFRNCEPIYDDWIGIFPADADPNNLGDPAQGFWLWTCGEEICTENVNYDVLQFGGGLVPGQYKLYMIHRNNGGVYRGHVGSDSFEIAAPGESCQSVR